MKALALVIVVLCSSVVGRAQQSDPKITLDDRLSKYMPALQPRPCSVWLTNWGASGDAVKAEAKRIGLELVDSTSLPDGDAIIYMYTEPSAEIYYSFSVIDGSYNLFTCSLSYNDLAEAKARYDAALQDLREHWGGDGKSTSTTAVCEPAKTRVSIEVGQSGNTVTFVIQTQYMTYSSRQITLPGNIHVAR
jgi:hypothetical protein